MQKIIAFLSNRDGAETLCNIILKILIVFATYVIVQSIGWIIADADQAMLMTGVEKKYLNWVFMNSYKWGRYQPLENYDYNLLNLIPLGYTVNGHYMLNIVTFVLTTSVLAAVLYRLKNTVSTVYIGTFFISLFPFYCSILGIHSCLIFSERTIIFALSLFILCYKKALETQSALYFVAAGIIALFTTYNKEPIFGVFLVIGLGSIFLKENKSKNEFVFDIFLIINAAVFLILWFEFNRGRCSYSSHTASETYLDVFQWIYGNLKIVILIFIFAVARAYFVLIKKDKKHLFYDLTLAGSVAYALAFVILRYCGGYFYSPCIILFAPSFVWWSSSFFESRRFILASATVIAALFPANFVPLSENFRRSRDQTNETMVKLKCLTHDKGKKIAVLPNEKGDYIVLDPLKKVLTYVNDRHYSFNIETKSVNIINAKWTDTVDKTALYFVPISQKHLMLSDQRFKDFVEGGDIMIYSEELHYVWYVCE